MSAVCGLNSSFHSSGHYSLRFPCGLMTHFTYYSKTSHILKEVQRMSLLSEDVAERLEKIEQQSLALETALRESPEGRLRVSTSGKHTRFYWINGSGNRSGQYLRREETQFAKRLAQKDYDRRVLKLLKQEYLLLKKLKRYYERGSDKKASPPGCSLKEFFTVPRNYYGSKKKKQENN